MYCLSVFDTKVKAPYIYSYNRYINSPFKVTTEPILWLVCGNWYEYFKICWNTLKAYAEQWGQNAINVHQQAKLELQLKSTIPLDYERKYIHLQDYIMVQLQKSIVKQIHPLYNENILFNIENNQEIC